VDPGNMNTAMHRAAEPDEDPNQWANPEDVTEVFIFLASDKSRGVNGKRFKAQEKGSWISTTNNDDVKASAGLHQQQKISMGSL
jgi:NAD(P)-dependent dehydrogenase (short-subunit alcohol dehydrogenase family)